MRITVNVRASHIALRPLAVGVSSKAKLERATGVRARRQRSEKTAQQPGADPVASMVRNLQSGWGMKTRSIEVLAVAILGLGCASAGTHPHDMSAAGHEAAARTEHERAEQASARALRGCPGYDSAEACHPGWTGFQSPTKRHLEEARTSRRLAEKHRASSNALRDAEARACQSIPDAERDTSPFFHVEDIVSIEHIPVDVGQNVLSGRRVVFRALPGMTKEWLQRLMDCHVARNAAFGYGHGHDLAYCPLAVKAVTARVTDHPLGWSIDLRPDSQEAAHELRRKVAVLFDIVHPAEQRRQIELAVTEKGFEPTSLKVRRGVPLTLTITRKTDATCATAIIVADYGIQEDLPIDRPVQIAFTPARTGRLKYACSLGKTMGVIIIE